MRKPFLTSVLVLAMAATTRADDDPIKTKLETARKDYDAKVEKYNKAINDWLDKKEETARKAGNKAAVDQIKSQRETFQDTGLLLTNPPPDVQRILTEAQKSYEGTLVTGVKDYTKAKKDAEAGEVSDRLKAFKEEIDQQANQIKKVLVGTWKVTVGDYKGEWTFTADGAVDGKGSGGSVPGKWTFDKPKGCITITWKGGLQDKFDLPLDPKGTAGSQVGRDDKKLDAVKK